MNENINTEGVSKATKKAIAILVRRDRISLTKYGGKTMDREDLTPREWLRHMLEEQADGIKYAVRTEEALAMLSEARSIIGEGPYSPEARAWVEDYDSKYARG